MHDLELAIVANLDVVLAHSVLASSALERAVVPQPRLAQPRVLASVASADPARLDLPQPARFSLAKLSRRLVRPPLETAPKLVLRFPDRVRRRDRRGGGSGRDGETRRSRRRRLRSVLGPVRELVPPRRFARVVVLLSTLGFRDRVSFNLAWCERPPQSTRAALPKRELRRIERERD